MKTYDKFLKYYDEIVRWINSPLEDEVDFLKFDVIENFAPNTKTILETACGTWVIAKELIKSGFKYTWLDINEKMLEIAKNNLKWLEKNLVLWESPYLYTNHFISSLLTHYYNIQKIR